MNIQQPCWLSFRSSHNYLRDASFHENLREHLTGCRSSIVHANTLSELLVIDEVTGGCKNSFAFFHSSYVGRNSCGPINLSFHVHYTALGVIVHFVLDSRRTRWPLYSFYRESISSMACSFTFLPFEFRSTLVKYMIQVFFLAVRKVVTGCR